MFSHFVRVGKLCNSFRCIRYVCTQKTSIIPYKDYRLHSVLLQNNLASLYHIFEAKEMDLTSFLRCKEEDLIKFAVTCPNERQQLLQCIETVKSKYDYITSLFYQMKECIMK